MTGRGELDGYKDFGRAGSKREPVIFDFKK
jgi:hypothetical protein